MRLCTRHLSIRDVTVTQVGGFVERGQIVLAVD